MVCATGSLNSSPITVLIVGNGRNRCPPSRSYDFTRTIQCNRVYEGFRKDIIIRNLNTTLERETGLTWEIAVTQFNEIWISFASATLTTDAARQSAFAARLRAGYERAKHLNPKHIMRWTQIETTQFLCNRLQKYPPFDTLPHTPTTGMMAIQEALNLGWRVHITGFDYFGGRPRIGSHRPTKEAAYQSELLNNGLLVVEV